MIDLEKTINAEKARKSIAALKNVAASKKAINVEKINKINDQLLNIQQTCKDAFENLAALETAVHAKASTGSTFLKLVIKFEEIIRA